MREHVDETVIAAGTKLGDPELEILNAAEPDTLLRVPFGELPPRALEALLREVRGDWVLWLADDEAPTAGLLAALGGLAAADAPLTSYALPRAAVTPARDAVLDARPWWPDLQARLLRTGPWLSHLPAPGDRGPLVAGPQLVLEHGLLRTGLSGEEVAGVPTRPLDPADAELLGRVLDGPEPPRAPLRGLPHTLPPTEIQRHAPVDRLPDARYAGSIELAERDLTFGLDTRRGVLVRVTNRSEATWPGSDRPGFPVRTSYRVLRADGSVLVADGMRTPLPIDVPPGQSRLVEVQVAVPETGDLTLEIDLVHEGVQWFGIGVQAPVTVR